MNFERASTQVAQSARRAAREISTDPLLIQEAIETAVDRLEDALLSGRKVRSPSAWGYRVGRTAAIRLARRRRNIGLVDGDAIARDSAANCRRPGPPTADISAALATREKVLTTRQLEAVHAVLQHGTYGAAAKFLKKDRSAVSRLFRRAMDRLRLAD